MSSRYGLHATPQERYYARANRQRVVRQSQQLVKGQAPFMGWCPDLPTELCGLSGFRSGYGIVAFPWRGSLNYALRPDIGWEKLDAGNLPRGGGRAGTGLADIRLDNGDYEGYLVSAGVTATTDITLSRFTAAGSWAAVAKNAAFTAPQVGRDYLWDSAVFPLGAPTRSSAINQAVLLFAGGSKSAAETVLVTPDATGIGSYDALDRFTALNPFKAKSVETFQGRAHFLNTVEGGTNFPRRCRWSAVGTADPDPAEVGAGFYDFAEFKRIGLRVESIGDKLACYFEDGVAYLRPTGIATNAYEPEIVSRTRGLLGTHALCQVASDVHFGVFDDGFWLLNAVQQWKRVGVIDHNGQSLTKFWHSFINSVDVNNRHRIVVTYDAPLHMVRIAYPSTVNPETNQVLNIVLNVTGTDVAWPDYYQKPVVMWGQWERQTQAGTTWAALTAAGTTWASLFSSGTLWSDFAAQYGLRAIIQTDDLGNVYGRDPLLYSQDGVVPTWYKEFQPLNLSEMLGEDQTFARFLVKYLDARGPSMNVLIGGDGIDFTQSQTLRLTEGSTTPFAQETAYADFKMLASSHSVRLSGTAPFLLLGWVGEVFTGAGRDLRGQS